MSRPEQRQSERIATDLPIRIERGDAVIDARTINMSLGGVLVDVRLSPAATIGERFGIALALPTLPDPLRAQAEVRWIGLTGEHGLQFVTGFRAKETWALGQWLDKIRKGSP
ncbi:MAG TPA: PilZ domain-containing protein [Nannocystaceae bacterium]|nr:PilZ domain-containing protein [Nannocystaceae bacterium]